MKWIVPILLILGFGFSLGYVIYETIKDGYENRRVKEKKSLRLKLIEWKQRMGRNIRYYVDEFVEKAIFAMRKGVIGKS